MNEHVTKFAVDEAGRAHYLLSYKGMTGCQAADLPGVCKRCSRYDACRTQGGHYNHNDADPQWRCDGGVWVTSARLVAMRMGLTWTQATQPVAP